MSTEDDKYSISNRLQSLQKEERKDLERLRFMFNTNSLLETIENAMKEQRADLVVIDTFSDIYDGEMNQVNKVRSFMNEYFNLAQKYECVVIFNHHTGKHTEEKPPSKNNSIGSAGFEGKARLVMELRADPKEDSIRHLCIVKGNYLGMEYKKSSFELKFDPVTGFIKTGKRTPFNALVKPKLYKPIASREEERKIICKLFKKGRSVRWIEKVLKRLGYSVGKTTIAELGKDCPSCSNP